MLRSPFSMPERYLVIATARLRRGLAPEPATISEHKGIPVRQFGDNCMSQAASLCRSTKCVIHALPIIARISALLRHRTNLGKLAI
jgi:hypothetical protein